MQGSHGFRLSSHVELVYRLLFDLPAFRFPPTMAPELLIVNLFRFNGSPFDDLHESLREFRGPCVEIFVDFLSISICVGAEMEGKEIHYGGVIKLFVYMSKPYIRRQLNEKRQPTSVRSHKSIILCG
jgi:hypothetical protein